MQSLNIIKEVEIKRTPRLMQCEGLFDIPPSKRSREEWTVNLALPDRWNIGLIVGPSGSGKTTIAREIFGACMVDSWEWPTDASVLDGFPQEMGIKEIVDLLSSVGFSSPPSWVRPFRALSNGEQFRVNMARTLAEQKELAVVDEFTSVVDRTVAQIGSSAIAKTVRRRNQKFIAVSCHYDIAEWLEPDWIYEPATDALTVGRLLRRPKINLAIKRVHSSAWQLFRKYHYLDTNINKAARCYIAFLFNKPVCFVAILPNLGTKNTWREHRTVVLPDFQGVGIGNQCSQLIASMCLGIGKRFTSTTSHPAMISYRARSDAWKMTKSPGFVTGTGFIKQRGKQGKYRGVSNRFVASFEYVGPAMKKREALNLWTD